MSASLVISVVMASRQTKLSASRLLEPRYMIPAVVGGAAGGYWLHHKLKNDWMPTQGDRIEDFVKRHPVAVGATIGGVATGAVGAMALRKLLKKLQHHEERAQEPAQAPPISIQIGDAALQQLGQADAPKVAHLKTAGPLMQLLRAYGQVGRAAAGAGGRALKSTARGAGQAAGWAGKQGRKYTGMGQVEAEHTVRNAILNNPALKRDYELLSAHTQQRGFNPRTGLGGVLMNPGGALGCHFSAAGRVGWDMEQLADPKAMKQLLRGSHPRIQRAAQNLQGMTIPHNGSQLAAQEFLRRESGQGWLIPTMFAGSMAAPLVLSGDRKARIAELNTPGDRKSMFQPAADAVGGWVGQNMSPTIGNWIQNHPGASAGIAGAGLAGAGLMGYHALKDDA